MFADLTLAKRLERAEGTTCVQFAQARRKLFPESGAEWIECAGAYAVFDGIDSPLTQTFGLGIFEELTPSTLDTIERFFHDRNAPVFHEVSPLAGVAALDLLCSRNYRPVEISSVLFQPIEPRPAPERTSVVAHVIQPGEQQLWQDISARGWTREHPELLDFFAQIGAIFAAREESICFLAEADGIPGAAGLLSIHEGVALFGGASTVPELRSRGLQAALLEARLRYAADQGCDLAMMVAEAGSNSQRNAERKGFRIACTRTRWRLF